MPTARLLTSSRYACCTPGVLDKCVRAVAAEAGLEGVIPDWSGHEVALVAQDALEAAEAGDLDRHAPSGSDWLLTLIAEARLFAAARHRKEGDAGGARAAWDEASAVLEKVAASSNRSGVLWYEDIYFEAAQSLVRRGDKLGLVRQVECIAEGLRNDAKGPNTLSEMRDLAFFYLKLGDHRRGLSILAELHRAKPSDPWAYNALALGLPGIGLNSLGRMAAERGLELVRRGNDPERLENQLSELLKEIGAAEDRSDAPSDVVDELRDALRTDFDSVASISPRDWALRLVPEVATARVKERPPMPTPDALAKIAAGLRAVFRSTAAVTPPPSETRAVPFPTLSLVEPIARTAPKVGRNDPCPCGSSKKFKKCCLGATSETVGR